MTSSTPKNPERRRFLGRAALTAAGISTGWPTSRAGAAQVQADALSAIRSATKIDEDYWWNVRAQFNVVDRLTFMNNGTLGPVPTLVRDAQSRVGREVAEDPTNGYRSEEIEDVREQVARFIAAPASEVALTRSTTEGMTLFAQGLKWNEGDEVLMCSHEHFGGKGPYYALRDKLGIKVVEFEIDSPPKSAEEIVSLYEKHITPRTRVVVVSHITYVTGLLMPVRELSELAHRHGALISVDGAHPLGMIPLDMQKMGCDHYAAAGQKWLLAGTGTGVAYFSPNAMDQVFPGVVPAPSYLEDQAIRDWLADKMETAGKYELFGQRHIPSVLGMSEAIRFQEAIGKKRIEERVRSLSLRLKRGLSEIPGVKIWTSGGEGLSAALTLFSIHDIPMDNIAKTVLERDRIYIRTMSSGNLNAVRASTHLYNMPGEVDRLLASVRHIAENADKYRTLKS